jgi:2-keto-3-deoxy-L-rhamnonate aldolase RhmA
MEPRAQSTPAGAWGEGPPALPLGAVSALARMRAMVGEGRAPIGIFVSSTDPAVTDVLGVAGFDYVILDGEHGRLDRAHVENHVRAARLRGVIPFVRALENAPTLLQSLLDVGAEGLFVPHVDTPEAAARAVAAVRYPPAGRRGMCPACLAGGYSLDGFRERSRAADANVMVIPIIESREAVANIEGILAVDGIEAVNFGPGDLSVDMGIDLTVEPEQLAPSWEKVRDACIAAGKMAIAPHGMGFEGAQVVFLEMELMFLARTAGAVVAQHRAGAPAA